jgi:hypothetical protein
VTDDVISMQASMKSNKNGDPPHLQGLTIRGMSFRSEDGSAVDAREGNGTVAKVKYPYTCVYGYWGMSRVLRTPPSKLGIKPRRKNSNETVGGGMNAFFCARNLMTNKNTTENRRCFVWHNLSKSIRGF